MGYGNIAERGHLPAYRMRREPFAASRQFEIVAIADLSEARLRAAQIATAASGARLYRSYRELFAAERNRVDFVDIATPPCDHAVIAHAALDCGFHVLCEKPLATRRDDARALLDHALAKERVIYPCHNYRHAPVVKAAQKILDSGAIGHVQLVTLDTFRTTHARGAPEWRPDWRRERTIAGGGIAMDHGAHTFYLAMNWLRAAPTAITAKMSTRGRSDTEDTIACTVSFPNALAIATLTWTAGVRKVIYTLHGERGAIRVEDDHIEVTTLATRGGEKAPRADSAESRRTEERVSSQWMDASHVSWFETMQDHFAQAIDANDYAGAEAVDALRCVELIGCAYTSALDGSREVALPGAARDLELPPAVGSAKERAS